MFNYNNRADVLTKGQSKQCNIGQVSKCKILTDCSTKKVHIYLKT